MHGGTGCRQVVGGTELISDMSRYLIPMTLFLVIFLGGFLFWRGRAQVGSAENLISPLGLGNQQPTPTNSLLEKITKSKTVLLNSSKYFPQSWKIEDKSDLGLDAQAYIAIDRDTRNILLGKNITQRLPIASLTKIVTSIVALEDSPLDLELYVSSAAANIGEATMGLGSGERVSVEEALYGLMLPSGNDAAETLAEGVGKKALGTPQKDIDGGGARSWFIDKMNETVQKIGAGDTYFFNPTGLDGNSLSQTNFSTVLDMAVLTNYALDKGEFAKIADTKELLIPYKAGFHKAFYLYNILSLNDSFPGIKGVKPGISDLSGETLSSYVERGSRRIIVIILGSRHTKDDALKIYKEIFEG